MSSSSHRPAIVPRLPRRAWAVLYAIIALEVVDIISTIVL